MLAVQVNYQGVAETIRHNQQAERQKDVELEQSWSSINETKRHNLATERLSAQSLGETTRHNMATESLGYANLAYNYQVLGETKRHNIASEGISWSGLQLDTLKLQEQHRHNMMSESLTAESNSIAKQRQITEAAQGWESLANQQYANKVKSREADIKQFEAETSRRRQEQDKFLGIWQNINGSVNAATEVSKEVRNWIPAYQSIFGTYPY